MIIKRHQVDYQEIDYSNLHLTPPCMAYMDSFRAAIADYRAYNVEDFGYPKVRTRAAAKAYIDKMDNMRRGLSVPRGFVPSSAFWLVDGRQYLGEGHVRHFLNDNLKRFGGNIGYSIRPKFWGKGLGTRQVALLLEEAKKLYIFRPIITCFEHNIASARIIEKNGGMLVQKVNNKINGRNRLTRIYQVDLTNQIVEELTSLTNDSKYVKII